MDATQRGDGVGIELTSSVVRGIVLSQDQPGRIRAAAEVPITNWDDDRLVVDAFVRLRAELGNPRYPTRVAVFPAASTMQRIDATGRTGPELNSLRKELEVERDITSSVLIDQGPRQWLLAVGWDADRIRPLDGLAERGGFVDVALEPSPLALVRVLASDLTVAIRDASETESFVMVVDAGVPVAAVSIDAVGRPHPALNVGRSQIPDEAFVDLLDPAELGARINRYAGKTASPTRQDPDATGTDDREAVMLLGSSYAPYAAHDVLYGGRQCVALGAAYAAAGLAGRQRPVDVILPPVEAATEIDRPWAIERLSNLPAATDTTGGRLAKLRARLTAR